MGIKSGLCVMETQRLNRKVYPSDISREQFEPIRERLENFKKRTKPRTVDLYDVFCGVLYVLKSGCQWRMLPSDFPKWRTVYDYNSQWRDRENEDPSLLEQLLKKKLAKYESKMGEKNRPVSVLWMHRV